MGGASEPVIIEIGDDAYKQNAVYRPWDEFQLGVTGEPSAAPSAPLDNLQTRLLTRHKSASVNVSL